MSEAQEVVICRKNLACAHCGRTVFVARRAQLNTALATFVNLDWLNESADVYVCSQCGHLHWFLTPKAAQDENYEIACFSCGATIPPGQTTCEKCGWTYKT